jgi:hypothetical protein
LVGGLFPSMNDLGLKDEVEKWLGEKTHDRVSRPGG